MPYNDQESRDELDPQIDKLIDQIDYTNMGEINYVVTRLCDALFDGEIRYGKINSLIGALECAKLELYRRVAAPYEDSKIKSNGEVYRSIPPEVPKATITPEDDNSEPRKSGYKWFFGS